jgi:hypothetical protein
MELETQKNKILKAVEESSDDFPDHLFAYLSTALHLSNKYYRKASWERVVGAFYKTIKLTLCQIELPMLSPTKEKTKEEPWNYPNHSWNSYVHMLASKYGWTIEYISNLKVEYALSCIQEILIDENLEKEYLWMLSERSSYYDNRSKTMKMNPYPRPNWMHKHIDPTKESVKVKIPVGMMPAGNGITQSDLIAQAS